MNGTYGLPSPAHQFGISFDGFNYKLPNDWKMASDGKGIVMMEKQFNIEHKGGVILTTIGIAGGPVGLAVALVTDITIMQNPDQVIPVYYDQIPRRPY
ncbi:MAG: hypothetical protein HZB19_11930 [Chloroflexi bacterium]|nr:hypothetical protein [Chloroflexota bacterium]